MSERPMLARLATDVLTGERVTEKSASPSAERRAIAALERAIVESRSRRRLRAGIVVAVGVVATAAAAFVVLRAGHAPAPVANGPSVSISVSGGAEQVGDRVVTNEGHATYALSTGTRVVVAPHADVRLDETPSLQEFALHSGALHADVAKLHVGTRFLVKTADAEVEVRGTSFDVSVADHATCGTVTSVSVSEGMVWVRFHGTESVVSAGGAWPPACTAAITPSPSPVPTSETQSFARLPAPVALMPTVAPTASPAPTLAPTAVAETSYLAEQNRIFEDALAAKRRGDIAAALAGFDRLTEGPHAESAAAERMRVLAVAHDARARGAAQAYMARYPNGFAAAEARALLAP